MRQLLTRNTQRYLCLLVLLILALPEAHACGGLSAEHKLFFTSLPDPLPDADVVAKVILLDVSIEDYRIGLATARVTEVLQEAEGGIEMGDVLSLKYPITSCGPGIKLARSVSSWRLQAPTAMAVLCGFRISIVKVTIEPLLQRRSLTGDLHSKS
ncbi:hypothetical protein [Halopseudomonas oceani]|uniref:hypothetical protein n=1 Tax=Halopseudomonas oceani TaxID=1708783 RepID=UPI002AA62B26|nr:hypothetical protein [Halopseudomonas oceani]